MVGTLRVALREEGLENVILRRVSYDKESKVHFGGVIWGITCLGALVARVVVVEKTLC